MCRPDKRSASGAAVDPWSLPGLLSRFMFSSANLVTLSAADGSKQIDLLCCQGSNAFNAQLLQPEHERHPVLRGYQKTMTDIK
jgi:hypothetical protein